MDTFRIGLLGSQVGGELVKRVTVLMGVYNPPAGMLTEAVESLLRQTLADFELLIVDDGSSEESRELLQQHGARDTRIRILWEPHRGLTGSLNRGLAAADSEYIARHDGDDWSIAERLSLQVRFLDARPELAVCGSNAWIHQENGRRLWRTHLPENERDVLAAFPHGNPMIHGSTMFRRAAALEAGGYCETFRCSQDYDFFWRLAEAGGAANLNEPLYHYRYVGGSISARKATEQLRAHRAIRKLAAARDKAQVLDPAMALQMADSELASDSGLYRARLKQADHQMLAGQYAEAAAAYGVLLREHPWNPLAWAKLARLGVFCGIPALRETCFR